jgi:hypothetical protein
MELVRDQSRPCGRSARSPSLGPAIRTAARSKFLLMAVESGGRGFASGKTALKALLFLRLLLMHTHRAHRTTTWKEPAVPPPDREPQATPQELDTRPVTAVNKRRSTNLARETRTLCPVAQTALIPWV